MPYDQGAVIDRLHGVATDIRQESTPEGTIIRARLPHREANRYAALRTDLPLPAEPGDRPSQSDDGPSGSDDASRRGREVG